MKKATYSTENFIKDKPSPLFYALFSKYVHYLYKHSFGHVGLSSSITFNSDSSYLFLLNHYTWWDGLLPILLHSKLFPYLKPKGIMDEEQLNKHPFFSKVHVFSINRNEPRKALESLNYASEHLKQSGTCLFLYPQGAIYPNDEHYFKFESGFERIVKQVSSIQVIPIVTYIEQLYQKKPNYWIHVGNPFAKDASILEIETEFKQQLKDVKKASLSKNFDLYKSLFV